MPIGVAAIVAKEAAKKAIKETAKQVAKETKKDVLKGKLKQAVKAEVKEEIKGKVVEEIDDNVMDIGSVAKTTEVMKGEGLKGKLSKAVKGEVRERVTDDINENIVDSGMVQKGKIALEATKSTPEKGNNLGQLPEDNKKITPTDIRGEQSEKFDRDDVRPISDEPGKWNPSDNIPVYKEATGTNDINNNADNVGNKAEVRNETNENVQDAPSETDKQNDSGSEGEKKTEKYEPNSYVSIDGNRYRTDDNGNIYQKRNPETGVYEGMPNTSYELNGYHYETDGKGRIKKADGILQEKNHEGRPTINDNVEGMQGNDEKGHLIGDQFNGSNLNGNLVAMDFDVNRSDYKKLEEKLSKCVNEEHKTVEYSVEPKYEGDSSRPTKFVVKYTIDGETFKETFKN